MSLPPGRGIGLLLLLVGVLATKPLTADPAWARAEFWMELEAVPALGSESDVSGAIEDEAAAGRILEEAAFVFSGMYEGFSFEWRPRDAARGIEEAFSLSPPGTIRPGDPRILPREARREGQVLRGYVEFHPDAADRAFRETLQGPGSFPAAGQGRAPLSLGSAGRRAAYEAAIRAGVEALLRKLEPNRPRVVRGRAIFEAPPSIAILEGAYFVKARLRIETTEVIRREIY